MIVSLNEGNVVMHVYVNDYDDLLSLCNEMYKLMMDNYYKLS